MQSSSRSIITKNIPTQISLNRSTIGDGIVLACMTFPGSRDSKRLQKLISLLGEIGQINLEDHEEQICDSMRLRLRLFVRRVINLVSENIHTFFTHTVCIFLYDTLFIDLLEQDIF